MANATQRWKLLPIPTVGDTPEGEQAYLDAIRLNSLGSLFFFISHTLGRNRLRKLHWQMCKELETEDLHAVFEIPMGHFKTTIGSEGLPMWWALPFTPRDEFMMQALGYGKEWIRWMKKAHDQNARTLITHAVDDQAIKFGKLVDDHYRNNRLFRAVFKEILPNNDCTWNDHSKFQVRTVGHGEGTFEYRGAGCALQGMHFDGIINDDCVGRDAQENWLNGDGQIIEGIYRWWKQTLTRFDSKSFTKTGIGRQLVTGNRWGHLDLNGRIRKNHPEFKIVRHSAEGGCCSEHPAGYSIFPEEFSMERLAHERATLMSYDYSHFYLNLEVMPEECIFKPEWIRHFQYKPSDPSLPLDDIRNILLLAHEVRAGEVREDIAAGSLYMRMLVDLAHAKKRKRSRHVIALVGLNTEADDFYLLDVWAKASPYSELVDNIYHLAHKWNLYDFWLEEVGAQNLLALAIQMKNQHLGSCAICGKPLRALFVNELPYDNSANAKTNRIESMEPIYKNGRFWTHRNQTEFHSEYDVYPATDTVDVLDTIGYAPDLFRNVRSRKAIDVLAQQREAFAARSCGSSGY